MAYIDKTYFTGYTPTTEIDCPEFEELAERASEIVDILTMGGIEAAGGIEAFPAADIERIKKATAAEVQFLFAQGGTDAINGFAAGAAGSMSLGKFSISGAGAGIEMVGNLPVSRMVRTHLFLTGLLNRAIGSVYSGADVDGN